MYESYANVLESYVIYDIAEEGFGDAVKNMGSKAIQILKGLKDRIISLFKKIADSIRRKRSQPQNDSSQDKKETQSNANASLEGKFIASCTKTIRHLSSAVGMLSKAIGQSRGVDDTNDSSVQVHIDNFNREMDSANEAFNDIIITSVSYKDVEILLKNAERIKNTFVQEVDLAMKILQSSQYSMANNAKHTSIGLTKQLCSANSRFLSTYTKLLNKINGSVR